MSDATASRWHWRDARAAAKRLRKRPAERRALLLLARLPLLPEAVLERLVGVWSGSGVYRTLRSVADDGLVAALRRPVQAGHGPRLWHLTNLGLATIAIDQRADPAHLARQEHLRGVDQLALQPGLPQLLAAYDLLLALAVSRPGPVRVLDWERPWRCRYVRPTAKAPVTVTLPACAALAWQNAAACSHAHVRPDGYGIYRYHGRLYGFFLEYDRDTMGFRDYCAKFGAYFDYLGSGRYTRDYDGFPAVLVVTPDSDAEERVAYAARAASVGRGESLPLLVTCRCRIEAPRNRDGFLGQIWRTQGGDGQRHRPWVRSGGTAPMTV